MSAQIILGIDTSCDDTGVGIVCGGEVVANVVASQTDIHAEFGGVMPEKASREHLKMIDLCTQRALNQAGLELADITTVAATYGPGLVGALLVGLNYAKALAWARGLDFVPVHHLEGHIASSLVGLELTTPCLCLIASGGHTSLFEVEALGSYCELGKTRDDAAGEAFDKAARLLGLGFPGGPLLSKLAAQGRIGPYHLPKPFGKHRGYDFSFSGLKTALSLLVNKLLKERGLDRVLELDIQSRADIAATFQDRVVTSLVETALRAAEHINSSHIIVAGGVAANATLRQRFHDSPLQATFPPLDLATDNGAMIALAAHFRSMGGERIEGSAHAWAQDAIPYQNLVEASSKPSECHGKVTICSEVSSK